MVGGMRNAEGEVGDGMGWDGMGYGGVCAVIVVETPID